MAHKKQGYRFENDWPLEVMKKDTEVVYRKAVAIPVNVEIEADHRVLNYDKVRQLLISASKISLLDCSCKRKRGNCDGPVRVCIGLNGNAERILNSRDDKDSWHSKLNPQEVSVDEALLVLKMSHEAGYVHMALTMNTDFARSIAINKDDNPDAVEYICSCCTCCCSILSGIIRYGLAPHLLTSDTISVTDLSSCTSCSICVDRCQFGAREIVNGSLTFNSDLCFGCGLCVSTCPKNAITLVDK